jgi:hypothetical protein
MHFFAYPQYRSDVTDFLVTMRRQNPAIKAGQVAGRALLWDKTIDRATQQEIEAGRVAQQAYVYQTGSDL